MERWKYLKRNLLFSLGYLLIVAVLWGLGVPCLFARFFGVPCPGCGMTRAWLSVLRLDLSAAFAYHPMFWSVPILYVYFLANGRLLPYKYADTAVLIAIALGFAVNWVLKLL